MLDLWLITHQDTSKVYGLLSELRKLSSNEPTKISVLDNSCNQNVAEVLSKLVLPGEDLHVSEENLYLAKGLDYLAKKTSGEFIVYLCSKHCEINHPEWLSDALSVMNSSTDIGMVGNLKTYQGLYDFKAFYEESPDPVSKFPHTLPLLENKFSREEIFEKANTQIFIEGGAWVLRREALDDCGGFETALVHGFVDVELSVRLQCHGWKIVNIPSWYSSASNGEVVKNGKDYKVTHIYRSK